MTAVKLRRSKIVEIYETLAAIKTALDEPMHRYRAAAMRRQIGDQAEAIIETRSDAEKKKPHAFTEAREELLRSLAKKDAEGRPLVAANQYVLDAAGQEEFTKGIAKLRETHKEILDAYAAEVERVNKFLREEDDFTPPVHKLNLSWFNKSVDQGHLEVLFTMIEDDAGGAPTEGEEAPKKANAKKG